MTGQPQTSRLYDLSATLVKNRWVRLFAGVLLLFELYNHGAIPAFITTQKSIENAAIAEAAALRQKAEAEQAEWKAITETEVATYASRKQKADARKAAAAARVAEAQETIARETAKVSEIRAKAEAAAAAGEADIKGQQVIIERERAAQAQRLNQANARNKEYEVAEERLGTMLAKQSAEDPAGFARDAMGAAWRRLSR